MPQSDGATSTPESGTPTSQAATADLKQLEQTAGSAKVTASSERDTHSHVDTAERFTDKIRARHVAPILFVCTTFVLAVASLMLLSPMLLLINNKEQLTNDLNDGLYAYYTYTNKILGGQVGSSCNEESISCKFKTMSPELKDSFERYGFKLPGASQASNKRYRVPLMTAPDGGGAIVNAATLATARKSPHTDQLINNVYSNRTGVFQDRQFYQRLITQYGIRQENSLDGDTISEFDDAFDERVEKGDGPRYRQETNSLDPPSDDNDTIDENGRGVFSLGSLGTQEDKWRTDIYDNLVNKANTHLSLACAYATYGRLIENAAVRAKSISTARFAMNYLAAADDIKSGSATNSFIATASLADKLSIVSNKQNAMDSISYLAPALGKSVSVQDRLEIALQLSAVKLLVVLAPGGPSAPGTLHLKNALTTNIVQNSAKDRSDSGLCAEGMSGSQNGLESQGRCWTPASMPLAGYIGAVAGGIIAAARDPIEKFICPASVKAVVDMVKGATKAEVTATLPTRLSVATTSEANNFKVRQTTGAKAQHVIFAGAGMILGDRAQSLGMRPADIASLTIYLKKAQALRQQTEQYERTMARSTPWDVSSPYSFVGSIAAKLVPVGAALPSQSWRASLSAVLSTLPVAVTTFAESSASALYTQPMHFQPARLQPLASACAMPAEMNGLIMPDFACNIRYSMTPQELDLSIDDIISYMTKPHPDNASKSLSQVQARDTSADPDRGNRMKQQAQEGANAAYIDKKTGKPNNYTEYAKFLEYCVNRYDPWGRVGMVVQTKDLDEQKQKEREQNEQPKIRPDGVPESNGNVLPDAPENDQSYYALGWGSAVDQDWYTGKKCMDDSSDMMKYFRGYTMACAILASMSGATQCWEKDTVPNSHDDFYTSNNIIFQARDQALQ